MKRERIKGIIKDLGGQKLDPHYLGFFECFNKQLFYEAHEVLEALWLSQRDGPDGALYKGLIQLAGAFVHVQKGRPDPALRLLGLAKSNLQLYEGLHQQLDIEAALALIEDWRGKIEGRGDSSERVLKDGRVPELRLRTGVSVSDIVRTPHEQVD